jgi:hypothetical protein
VLSWVVWKVKQDLLPGDGFVSFQSYSSVLKYSSIVVIIEGTATTPIDFAAAFVLPDYPEITKWSDTHKYLYSIPSILTHCMQVNGARATPCNATDCRRGQRTGRPQIEFS